MAARWSSRKPNARNSLRTSLTAECSCLRERTRPDFRRTRVFMRAPWIWGGGTMILQERAAN